MSDIAIRRVGCAGRITLQRPGALNALSHAMARAVDAALIDWATDPEVHLVVIDAEGERAFCAGGDLAEIHAAGIAGDLEFARGYWRDEYRMDARIAGYPKPVVSLMQGFTMGGGVGLGCHASHRVVCASSRIAMPEVGIGLAPDAGGTLLLARAPGRCGEYLALTAARMGPGDAIHAGFADHHVPQERWPALIATLEQGGDPGAIARAEAPPPDAPLAALQAEIDAIFAHRSLAGIAKALAAEPGAAMVDARRRMKAHAPLSMACALAMIREVRRGDLGILDALTREYRFTHRAIARGDFLEGIRALIVDKDKRPRWRHEALESVLANDIDAMLAPLGEAEWHMEAKETA